ncbi:hypothetical protein AB0C65_38305 [Nocardia sp. NPDC048505]|uniref:hypothetical protein n=1 Tax=Nocardia sp. NPDC048505 TaxID=3155756 RepID=UPI0033C60820
MATNLITPTRCDHCRRFAVEFLPMAAPHDQVDMVCVTCMADYWATDEDADYS